MDRGIHKPGRIDWVDYAKGFCIVMVVMMHSTLGVEQAAGELSYGRKRALELATTLALDPELLLLDEPMAGLGVEDIERISVLIRQVALPAARSAFFASMLFSSAGKPSRSSVAVKSERRSASSLTVPFR